jgi:SAM-dependent methyltransferase
VHNHPAAESALALSGERTLPGIAHENYWFRRHEVAYRAVLRYCRYADVLDAGCGEGYGAELLRTDAEARVVALDRDEQTIRHVRRTYPTLRAIRGDLLAMPFNDGAFDAVAALRVIERLRDTQLFVRECVRMLRPVGTLLLSTPNRLALSPHQSPADKPLNPLHTHEFTPDELVDLLDSWFNVTRVLGVHHGQRLTEWEAQHGSIAEGQAAGPPETWSPELSQMVASVTADDFDVSAAYIDSSADVLVVAARR